MTKYRRRRRPYYQVSPVAFPGFSGGLNLAAGPDAVSETEAIDLLNVMFTLKGAVKQRDGYGLLTASPLTNPVDSLSVYYPSTGTKHLLAGCGTRLEAVNTAGAVVASATGLSGGPYGFARFGTPGSELAFAGNGTDTLRQWNGTAWSAPTATVDGVAGRSLPKAGTLAVEPNNNRLVATGFATTTGGPNGTVSGPSYVYWSEPGDALTWSTTGGTGANVVQLTPGDGEKIQAVVVWREMYFVFKESKFFVFYGDSTASDGTPVFNYRAVTANVGAVGPRGVCVAPDGVYFMDRKGIYRTTGGEPQLISTLVAPLFFGNVSLYFQSSTINQAQLSKCVLWWHVNRLYLAYPSGVGTVNDRVLVFATDSGWWSLYDLPVAAMTSYRPGSVDELAFGLTTANHVGRYYENSTYTSDNGAAITSRWRSGWFDMGSQSVKKIRESKMWGEGTALFSQSNDWKLAPQQGTSVQFGPSPETWGDGTDSAKTWGDGTDPLKLWGPSGTVSPKLVRKAIRGTVFSQQFSNGTLNKAWTVHRLENNVGAFRSPTTVETDP